MKKYLLILTTAIVVVVTGCEHKHSKAKTIELADSSVVVQTLNLPPTPVPLKDPSSTFVPSPLIFV